MSMKFVWRVVLLSLFVLPRAGSPSVAIHDRIGSPHGLDSIYREFNEQYFSEKLPKNVLIDFSEHGPYLATTEKMIDGRFRIAFNSDYVTAQRVAREVMLHEQCHIKTWVDTEDEEDFKTGRHNRRWIACMLTVDMQGGFRRELIDYYEGN